MAYQERLAAFGTRPARQQRRQAELESHLKEIEEAGRRFTDEYLHVQQQNANLANLYVASYRLHGTVERGEVVLAIQEIVANLIGSEELAIFEREPGSAELSLVASFGVDEAPLRRIAVGAGLIGRAAATGEVYIRGEGDAGIASSGRIAGDGVHPAEPRRAGHGRDRHLPAALAQARAGRGRPRAVRPARQPGGGGAVLHAAAPAVRPLRAGGAGGHTRDGLEEMEGPGGGAGRRGRH